MGNKGDKDQSKPKTFVLSTLAVGNSNTGKTTLLKYLIRHIPDGTDENGNTDLGDPNNRCIM